MCFLYLLLGHLMGDFILQTDKIADNKVKYRGWNVLHAIVVTVSMLLLAVPFGVLVMTLVILNGVMHYLVDFYKPVIAKRYPLAPLIYFVLDQGIHIFLIFIISRFAYNAGGLFFSRELITIFLVLVFISSFAAVLNQYVLSLIFPLHGKKFFQEDEKSIGNFTRLSITASLYLSYCFSPIFLLLLIILVIIILYHFNRKWYIWMKLSQFSVKMLTDLVISTIGFVILLNL